MEPTACSFVDWTQFFPTLLATCIGCMLAILLTSLYDRYNVTRERTAALKNIKFELEKIKSELTSIMSEEKPETCFYLSPLHTPSYDSLVYTRKLGLILEIDWMRKLYSSNNPKDSFLLLYEYIEEYNVWQNWRTTNKSMPEVERKFADTHIKDLHQIIIERIDKFLDTYRRNEHE